MPEPASLRVRALRMLARREYSRFELRARLISDDSPANEVENLLDEFEQKGWVSEQRFVDALVRTRRARFGSIKVLQELKQKGVSEEGIARAREALVESELQAARDVWQKKFAGRPGSMAERAKQARFLGGRGFSQEVVRKVLDWHDE